MFGKHFQLNEQTLALVEAIGKSIPGGFCIYKAAEPEELLYANQVLVDIFGCDDLADFRRLTGFTFRGMVHPEDYAAITAAIREQIAGNDDSLDRAEFRIIRKDGAVRWVDDYGHYMETEAYGGIYYVFLSDITEKREQMESDMAVRQAVIEALSETYHTVWLINDVETESFSLYRGDVAGKTVHASPIQNALGNMKYSQAKEQYVGTVVAPCDRERLRAELALDNLARRLRKRPHFSLNYLRLMADGSERYFRIEFSKMDMPGGKMGVVCGFKDVDQEVREAQRAEKALRDTETAELQKRLALQQKLLEQEKHREQQDKMITAMASDYRAVYHVNLDENDGVCYRADPGDPEQTPEGVHFPYLERFRLYAEKYVTEHYREEFLRFIEPDSIRERLSQEVIIVYRYLARRGGREYYEMLRMAGVRHAEDRDDHIVHAIGLGFTVIDAQMRDAMARNRALNDALLAANEASKAKTAFLSSMSHEIRTPMNAIIGLNTLALHDGTLSPQTREYLEKIGASARHLLGLINDILDMSRIESGRIVLRREEFSFSAMLEQINTMVMSQCSDKGLHYECRILSRVDDYYIGDDMKLKEVLINILSNAIKFTDAPGSITFTVERTAEFEHQSTLRFRIKDTGIGMDKSFLPRIFDSFSQEDSSRKNKYGSTGLGMAITKAIVEMMNGVISVESEKGVGTEFTVVITLRNSEHAGIDTEHSIDPNTLRVLVVDDEKIAGEHARMVLDEAGIRADVCLSGAEALHMLDVQHTKQEPYNLVLLDWKMPEMDGLEVARQIRGRYSNETTVIILTAYNWDEILDEALRTGVDSFLAKPLFASNVVSEFERIARRNNMSLFREKQQAELDGRRVLLAEDMEINAEIMMDILSMRGIEADHAENGRIAVEMFRASAVGAYSAILMDIRMPEMDGLEAAETIRALDRPDAKTIPIIALTANAFDEDVQRSLQVGMNAHLTKPVESEHLYQTLGELIWEAEQRAACP